MHPFTTRIVHATQVVEYWLGKENLMGPQEGSVLRPTTPRVDALPQNQVLLPSMKRAVPWSYLNKLASTSWNEM